MKRMRGQRYRGSALHQEIVRRVESLFAVADQVEARLSADADTGMRAPSDGSLLLNESPAS